MYDSILKSPWPPEAVSTEMAAGIAQGTTTVRAFSHFPGVERVSWKSSLCTCPVLAMDPGLCLHATELPRCYTCGICSFYFIKRLAHFLYSCGIFLLLWNKDEISQDQQTPPQGQEMEQEDSVLASAERVKTLDGVIQGRHPWTEVWKQILCKSVSMKHLCLQPLDPLSGCTLPRA